MKGYIRCWRCAALLQCPFTDLLVIIGITHCKNIIILTVNFEEKFTFGIYVFRKLRTPVLSVIPVDIER